MEPDPSRPAATTPDSEYSLTIEEALERYDRAGHARTPRTVQRYCAQGHLDCRRVETQFGEKYLITPASVSRHIAYIEETRPVAAGRDESRIVAAENIAENQPDEQRQAAATVNDERRHGPTLSQPVAPGFPARQDDQQRQATTPATREPQPVAAQPDLRDKYIDRLEGEVEFLREELTTKNAQIKELTERSRETNVLIGGLQRMLAPLLGTSNPFPRSADDDPQSGMRG